MGDRTAARPPLLRRRVSGAGSVLQSSPSNASAYAGNGARLTARVKPTEIVNASGSTPATQAPPPRRAPSSLSSGGGRSDTAPIGSPGSSSSRSALSTGGASSTSTPNTTPKARPSVAKPHSARTGTPPSAITPTPRARRASVIGVSPRSPRSPPPTTTARASPPRRSPSISGAPPNAQVVGARFKAALAGHSPEQVITSPAVSAPQPRVHVRAPSLASLPTKQAAPTPAPRPALSALGMSDEITPPPGAATPNMRTPRPIPIHSPHSGGSAGHSSLAEVTPSWANQTMHVSSSLLSPSTLVPSARPPSPPQNGLEANEPRFGTAVLFPGDLDAPSSNHSSPGRPSIALDGPSPLQAVFPHVHHHPTASCPTSPIPSDRQLATSLSPKRPSRPSLPWNPHSTQLPRQPPPDSPELRTVDLPMMTPTLSPDSADDYMSVPPALQPVPPSALMNGGPHYASSSEASGSDYGSSRSVASRVRTERRDRMSGTTVADADELDDVKLEAVFSDEEKAKTDRKVADLEISNASLMAINRSLEATKQKQRGEILRLRRMLRESAQGLVKQAADATPPLAVSTSTAVPHQLQRVQSTDDEGGGWGDDEMEDPALEARWERLASLVGTMRKHGEDAVQRSKESKPAMQRVLGWLEIEALTGETAPSQDVSAAPSEMDVDADEGARADAYTADSYATDTTEATEATHSTRSRSTNLSAVSAATQLAGEVLPHSAHSSQR